MYRQAEVIVQVRADGAGAGIERRASDAAQKGPAPSGVSASGSLALSGGLGGNSSNQGSKPARNPATNPAA
jgi:hypothetical protein